MWLRVWYGSRDELVWNCVSGKCKAEDMVGKMKSRKDKKQRTQGGDMVVCFTFLGCKRDTLI